MMKPFELPSSLLVALFAYSSFLTASPTQTNTVTITQTQVQTQTQLPSTGSGPDYATSCLAAHSSYASAYSVWTKAHESVSTTIETLGGTSISSVNYIANASTLCDGHPRVTASNYVTLSSGSITYVNPVIGYSTIRNTYFSNYDPPSPTCQISPSDCDPLWSTYLSSLSARGPQVTSPPLTTPPCLNQTAASSYASATESIYGCGKCTIYGEGVQLVFWPEPTTVSRNMCASTPTANVTHYGPSAVITAYAGKSVGNDSGKDASLRGYATADGKETIVADGHIFTSGTAYISISKVYAVDRCTKTFGAVVTDAILAMPSQSVLSLRYSQDHFQRLMETDKITGYPVNFADFHTPIPWSAWNGQNKCQGPQDNYYCTVINEYFFRPQLAIPPQITELSPEFKDCQLWYNGLWDPPLALTERSAVAKPTLPAWYTQTTSSYSEPASPSSTVVAPTATATTAPTALPNELPSSYDDQSSESTRPSTASQYVKPTENEPETPPGTESGKTKASVAKPTLPAPKAAVPSNEPWTTSFDLGGETYTATGSNKQAVFGTVTCSSGGPAQKLANGFVATYGSNGCILELNTIVQFDDAQPTNGPTTPDVDTVVVTVSGNSPLTVVQSTDGGALVAGTYTLTPGASAATLDKGEVLSAVTNGISVHSQTTLGVSNADSGSTQQIDSTGGGGSGSSGNGGSSATANGGAESTSNAEQSSSPSNSGSSISGSKPITASILTSCIMVLFMAAVLAV